MRKAVDKQFWVRNGRKKTEESRDIIRPPRVDAHNPMEDPADDADNYCGYCNALFASVPLRIEHETTSHTPWHCPECEMRFPTGPLFEAHQKAHRKFSCDVCSYTCKTKAMLRQHVATHTNVKNFKCAICSKAFTTPEYLAKHRRRHDRVRPYKFSCTQCVRALRTRASLLKHVEKMHGGEKPTYDCSFCGKKFDEAVYLSRHEARHKTDKAIPCPKCDSVCKNAWQLRVHKKTHKSSSPSATSAAL